MIGQDHGPEDLHKDGIYLNFIKFYDEKDDKFYLGYHMKTKEGDDETWDGTLRRTDFTFRQSGGDAITFNLFGKRYKLTDMGELHEFDLEKGMEFHRIWTKLETE